MTERAPKKYERLERSLTPPEVLPALCELEGAGAFGITLRWLEDRVELTAWKGKEGPCYETGRNATYAGPCLAVGDDDHHFIAGTIRVCEKTGMIYQSDPYRDLLDVTEPDPGLFSRLNTDPEPFDCDTLARDAADIADRIERRAERAEAVVVYLGPFRYIVLDNGTILRRGIPAGISLEHGDLLVSEGYAAGLSLRAPTAPNFLDLYGRYGPLFLAGRGGGRTPIRMPDLNPLKDLSQATRDRLSKMIARDDEYFMLQGTDPEVGGCCPLPHVGESNRLVEAGILDSWQSPMSPECPVTAYAMAGEVGKVKDGMPRFHRNELLRMAVRKLLG